MVNFRIRVLIALMHLGGLLAFVPTTRPIQGKPALAFGLEATRQHEAIDLVDRTLRHAEKACKTLAATCVLTVSLMFSPASLTESHHHPTMMFPAFADEQVVVAETAKPMVASATPEGEIATTKAKPAPPQTVIEEAASLVNKYYLEREFNGQNWDQVTNKYLDLDKKNDGSGDKSMKLLTEMIQTLGDKYSRVLSPDAYAAIQKFDLIGIGATLMPNEAKQIIVGSPPVPGSAAAKAGLKIGDVIEGVNGVTTKGKTAFDIIDQIQDKPDAKTITMTVRTPGSDDLQGEGNTRDIVMNRQSQKVNDPVIYKLSEKRDDGRVVGYIRIAEFNSLVKDKLEVAIRDLEGKGANAFVLDLRGNPGGAFQSAVEISSLFFENKVATYVVDSNVENVPFRVPPGRVVVPADDPIAIWVDSKSASAAEVLAGSLHDNCRGVVMGSSNSYGKGMIQAVYGLKNGAGLVLTVAKYVTPNGTEIQGKGIAPDINQALPNPFLQPADTTAVDFDDITKRLEMCVPPYRQPNNVNAKSTASLKQRY